MKKIYFNGFILFLILILNHYFHFDFFIQNWFYLNGEHRWIVDAENPLLKLIFYKGVKWAIIVFGATLVFRYLYTGYTTKIWNNSKQLDWLHIILSLAIVPAFISFLKSSTHMHCPEELLQYNGGYPYIRLFQDHPLNIPFGKCFPAGHASGGFALIALGYTSSRKKSARWFGLALGWIMGLYQMMKGDHFISHTLVTQQIALLFNELLYFLRSYYFSTNSKQPE